MLESESLGVVTLPERGAKIVEMRHLPSGREWLRQPTTRGLHRDLVPGSCIDGDSSVEVTAEEGVQAWTS